jgi:hypothetical protein
MKKALLILLAFALVFGLVFAACSNGTTGGRSQDPPVVDNSLKDLVVDGAEIVLKSCGNAGKPEHVSGNKFKLVDQDSLDNVGFYWEFPEEVVGKGYGAINIEMEVISIENPDFIGFMTHSTSSINSAVNVIDKKTGQPKTGAYDHEFKLGVECEKSAPGDTAEGGDGILDGSSKAGVKHDESYPFAKFKDVIAFQVNKYAGNITTPTWSSATGKATFEIAVTKVTFVGGAVPDSTVDVKAIAGVTPPASGATPVAKITETAQFAGTVAWKGAGGAAVGETFADGTIYTATITLEAKDGFTFEGVAANFFTVAGATAVTNDKDSGVVTAVFPATQAPATTLTVKVGSTEQQVTLTNVGTGTFEYLNDGSGYTFTYPVTGANVGYGNSYVSFAVNLGAGKTLSNFSTIKATFVGVAGDIGWKHVFLFASATALDTPMADSNANIGDHNANQANTTAATATYDISTVSGITSQTVYLAIIFWGGNASSDVATSYTISDIEIIE